MADFLRLNNEQRPDKGNGVVVLDRASCDGSVLKIIHAGRETAYVVTRKSAKTTIEDYQRCVIRPVNPIQCLLSDL